MDIQYDSVVILDIGASQIRSLTKMAVIFKMAAMTYLKFSDIVG